MLSDHTLLKCSQTHGSAEIDSTFPDQLREPILRKVQFSTIGRIDELGTFRIIINFICGSLLIFLSHQLIPFTRYASTHRAWLCSVNMKQTFKEDFFPGEHVQFSLKDFKDPGERWVGVIHDKVSYPEARYSYDTLDRPVLSRYHITVTGGPIHEVVVDDIDVFRDRRSFTKQVLRSFLKNTVSRERWEGAPWLVKDTIARTYNIDTAVPVKLQHENILAEKKAHAALKRGRPDEQCLEFFAAHGEIPGLAQATQQYKGKLPKELVTHFQDTLAGKISGPPPRPSAHGSFPYHDKILKLHPPAPPPPPPVTIKYPIDDLEIMPRKNQPHRPVLKFFREVEPSSPSAIGSDSAISIHKAPVGSMLEIWNTLNVHASFFILEHFNFDDFVDAMLYSSNDVECELLSEVHCAVLKTLIDEHGNADSAIPEVLDSDDEEDQSSAEHSKLSTPAPETFTRTNGKSTRSSLLRNDISEAILSHPNGNATTRAHTNRAEEMFGEQDWTDRIKARDFGAGGWQMIVIGLLHHLTLAGKHNTTTSEILSFLAPLNMKATKETARLQYANMNGNLRAAALETVILLAVTTKKMKDSMESRMAIMTDDRKEKVTWQRERKGM